MKSKLREFWCWVTTGHDFRETDITSDVLTAYCVDCGEQITVVLRVGAGEMINTGVGLFKARLKALMEPTFPGNAGVTRHVLGPIPMSLVSEEAKPFLDGDTSIGFNPLKPFDHKAHAATRRRGKNGRFLPVMLDDRGIAILKKIKNRRPRNRKGQFAKGKKK